MIVREKHGLHITIEKARVFGLDDSIVASGYPMKTEIANRDTIDADYSKELVRATKLGQSRAGSGHDCFLKGIIVQFDLTANEYFWRQLGRYHFIDHVSSQSKMHRLTSMNLDDVLSHEVDDRIKVVIKEMIRDYQILGDEVEDAINNGDQELSVQLQVEKAKLFHKIVSNTPMGISLTSRQTTNYLQLKTIYAQRKNHKLDDWTEFCEWIDRLPESHLITGGYYGN